jgi:hypothetical protein
MRYRVGDGKDISLWYDNWDPLGPLAIRFGERIIYDGGLGSNAKVEAIVADKEWKWPAAQSMAWLEVKQATPEDFKPDSYRKDTLRWVEDPKGRFT